MRRDVRFFLKDDDAALGVLLGQAISRRQADDAAADDHHIMHGETVFAPHATAGCL